MAVSDTRRTDQHFKLSFSLSEHEKVEDNKQQHHWNSGTDRVLVMNASNFQKLRSGALMTPK